jgi:hypothetical protein
MFVLRRPSLLISLYVVQGVNQSWLFPIVNFPFVFSNIPAAPAGKMLKWTGGAQVPVKIIFVSYMFLSRLF